MITLRMLKTSWNRAAQGPGRSRYLGVLLLAAMPLSANPVLLGQFGVTPDVFNLSGSPTTLATVSGTFSSTDGMSTGHWIETVMLDPFGVTCGGCLDFVLQVRYSIFD